MMPNHLPVMSPAPLRNDNQLTADFPKVEQPTVKDNDPTVTAEIYTACHAALRGTGTRSVDKDQDHEAEQGLNLATGNNHDPTAHGLAADPAAQSKNEIMAHQCTVNLRKMTQLVSEETWMP